MYMYMYMNIKIGIFLLFSKFYLDLSFYWKVKFKIHVLLLKIVNCLLQNFLSKYGCRLTCLKDKQNALMLICFCCSGFTKTSDYDPQHRNPLYCRADAECVWELQKLSQHFHPTVSLFASNLLKVWPQEWGDFQQTFNCENKPSI